MTCYDIENIITIGTPLAVIYQTIMTIAELAVQINAQLYPGAREPSPEVTGIHTACTMSSLIANASRDTLLVTSLNNSQLIRVAELMDAPGLCLAGAVQPVPELLALARRSGITIMVSPHSLEETRDRLEAYLVGRGRGAARGAARA